MNDAVILPAAAAEPSPGALLAAARERNGLTVIDVARQLKLSPWQVEALESGDYGRLPSAVFVRGFIRNYARVVKLDAAPLLAGIAHTEPRPPLVDIDSLHSVETPFPTGREVNWRKYGIAAAAVVVSLAAFEFYFDDAPEPAANSRVVELQPPRAAEQAGAGGQPQGAMPPAADSTAAAEPAQGETPGAAPDANARRAANEQQVRFRFVQASWVEIRDRDGRKIFSQFNPAGTEQVVVGLAPLTLVVGNARGVDLTYNEQPIDLGPHTKVDVARLTLE